MMLMLWLILRILGLGEDRAFVVSVVVAEAYLVGRNLPQAAKNIDDVHNGEVKMLAWPVGITLALAALQLIVQDPLFTQRIISGFSIFFLLIMFLGMLRERDVLDKVPHPSIATKADVPKVNLLRINALMSLVVLSVNEMLITANSLTIWITGIPLLVLVLHASYWILVILMLRGRD